MVVVFFLCCKMQVFHIAGSWHEGVNFQNSACTIYKLMPEEISTVTSPAVQSRAARRGGWGREEERVGKRCLPPPIWMEALW